MDSFIVSLPERIDPTAPFDSNWDNWSPSFAEYTTRKRSYTLFVSWIYHLRSDEP